MLSSCSLSRLYAIFHSINSLCEIKSGDVTRKVFRCQVLSSSTRSTIVNSLPLVRGVSLFFQLTSSRRMWKSTGRKPRLRVRRQKLRISAHSAARYATIIPSLANPLFSLQLSRRFFCDSRAPAYVHMTLRNNGLRSFFFAAKRADRGAYLSDPGAHVYARRGPRIIRLQSFALNHEANDASWRWSRRGEITGMKLI